MFWIQLTFALSMTAQNLPYEYRISEDGHRLTIGGNPSTEFYEESIIRSIDLDFGPNWNFDDLNDSNDLLGKLSFEGQVYDSVGVRIKGFTSNFSNQTEKKSLNITIDYGIDKQNIWGYETLNLNSGYEDPSSMREVLYNHIGRNYTPGLKGNFVDLNINGENCGPYLNIQQLNGDYIREWFLSNNGTRWRCW